jgi:hypothetical protein
MSERNHPFSSDRVQNAQSKILTELRLSGTVTDKYLLTQTEYSKEEIYKAIENLLNSGIIRKIGTVSQYSTITKQTTELSTYEKINPTKKSRKANLSTPKNSAIQPPNRKTSGSPQRQMRSLSPMQQNQKTENKCPYCETTYTGLLCPKCVNCETQYLGAERCPKCNKTIPQKHQSTTENTPKWWTETNRSTTYW